MEWNSKFDTQEFGKSIIVEIIREFCSMAEKCVNFNNEIKYNIAIPKKNAM